MIILCRCFHYILCKFAKNTNRITFAAGCREILCKGKKEADTRHAPASVSVRIMKKSIVKLCVLLMTAAIVGSSASAAVAVKHTPSTPYGWYFVPNNTGTTPLLDPGMKFAEEHGGRYCDHACENGEKLIYLTFDAGYENGNIEKIVDTLDAHGVKGSFFILENLIRRNPELIKRLADEGHEVCNHTCLHHDMTKSSREEFDSELRNLEEQYTALTGKELTRCYRPPEGRFTEQNLDWASELGYKTVFWSFAYADWDNNNQPDPEKSIEKILSHTHPGMIILLHPTSATNAAILDTLLCKWEEEGYSFGTVGELE